ncbi:MAG: SusC/RagA family TonB-linked outer membrane protein, partial [Rikenellaceae bacterium]
MTSSVYAAEKDPITVKLIGKPLSELFDQIEKKSGYSFVYDNTINVSKNVTVEFANATVENVLSSTLSKHGLTYKIIDNQIVITKSGSEQKEQAEPSNEKVKFVIKGAGGEPILGATVVIKGTTIGDITGIDGTAYIAAKKGDMIEVSYVGYKPANILLGNEKMKEVTLEEDALLVEDVVVVGFGTQKKVNLTGAVSSVKMDEVLGERPISNVKTALQGIIPGLQITSANGRPGVDMALNIRGTNSINGGSPLILVDNIPMDINMVNPSDIESVNVLKDAAASAIYGARAAFGVVLITTKHGIKGDKIQLNYSGNFSFSTPTDLPRVASPIDAIKALASSGQTADATLGCNLEKWMGYINEYNNDPSKYPNGYTIDDLGTKYYLKENDHVRNMMDNFGFQHMHNISLSGSTPKTSYRVSVGIVDEDGIVYSKKDKYTRYNLSSYVSAKPLDWLDISADLKYADSEKTLVTNGVRGGVWGSAMNTPSYMPIVNEIIDGKEYLPETSKTAIILGSENPAKNSNLRALGRAVITPLKGLSVTGEYGFTRDVQQTSTYDKLFYYGTPIGETKPSVQNSKYRIDQNNDLLHTLNVFANYTKEWKNHTLSAMAGYNQEDSDTKNYWLSKKDIINDELPSISQATGDMDMSDSYLQYSTRSLFYRLNYNFKERYLLEVNGRYDGSSKFPKDSRFGFFPSASVAWRLSEEKFMDWSRNYLSNLKLRASYGSIGNQSINPY